MSAKNKGGRPRSYTSEQVEDAIDRVEARGDIADCASVKGVMHEELGVSPGIDLTILKDEIERLCHLRAEEKAGLLVAKLPDPAKGAATGVGNEVARAVTAVLAEQFDQLNEESRKRESEIESDLRLFRRRVQGLEAQIAIHEASTATLEEENLNLADTEITALNAQIVQLGRDGDLEGRFVEIVRDFLAGNMQKGRDHELNPSA